MKKELQLIFDFDDTLVRTSVEYDKTNQQAADRIAQVLYEDIQQANEILAYERQLDLGLIPQYGFVPKRYIHSWVQTYEELAQQAGIKADETVKEELVEIVKDVYVRKYRNIYNAIPTLKQLKESGYSMMILTAGIDLIQRRKIKEAGIDKFMEEIEVRPKKTPEIFRSIMQKYPAEEYIMIGNSLKSDIYPALENGAWGFHVERKTWAIDNYPIDRNHTKYVHLKSISELPSKLQFISTLQCSSKV